MAAVKAFGVYKKIRRTNMMKLNIKKAATLLLAGLVMTSGTAMAMEGMELYRIGPSTGSVILSKGGSEEYTNTHGNRMPNINGVALTVTKSTTTLSAGYPVYFRLRKDKDINSVTNYASNTATFEGLGSNFLTYYGGVSEWYLMGRTDSSSTQGTTVYYTYSY